MTLNFAANLTHLWPELPFLDRFDAAAEAGFKAVEILFPYDVAAKEIQAALGRNGLQMILLNAPPPNYTGGPRGFSAQPGKEARFQSDMRRVFRYATALGVGLIHVMTGEAEGDVAKATMIENMAWAAQAAPKGITLMLEPLNPVAMPGYFLNDYALAADILNQLGAKNVALQFDSYHSQMIHGDAVATFEKYRPLIRHIQIGDAPERSAPGTGKVDFKALFEAIKASKYEGWISGDYTPNGPTEPTLHWMKNS